jgi:hypothetical protein
VLKKYFEFHDGSLDGLLVEDKSVHVFVSKLNQEHFVIEALGVAALNANHFKQGNIIFGISIRNANELTLEDIETVHGEFPEVSRAHFATRSLELALEKNLSLLVIDPSYGATCLVLAATFNLCTRRDWVELTCLPRLVRKSKMLRALDCSIGEAGETHV